MMTNYVPARMRDGETFSVRKVVHAVDLDTNASVCGQVREEWFFSDAHGDLSLTCRSCINKLRKRGREKT